MLKTKYLPILVLYGNGVLIPKLLNSPFALLYCYLFLKLLDLCFLHFSTL